MGEIDIIFRGISTFSTFDVVRFTITLLGVQSTVSVESAQSKGVGGVACGLNPLTLRLSLEDIVCFSHTF